MELNRHQRLVCVEKIEVYAQNNGSYLRPAFKVTFREGCFEREIVRTVVRTLLVLVRLGGENNRTVYLGHKIVSRERAVIFYRDGEWPERYYSFFVGNMERVAAHYSWHFSCTRKVPDAHPMGAVQK